MESLCCTHGNNIVCESTILKKKVSFAAISLQSDAQGDFLNFLAISGK